MYFYFYHAFMILSLIMSLLVIVLMRPRRNFYGAKAMTALAAATFVWTLGFLLEANSGTLERQLYFTNIGYLGSMSVPVAWFVFALNYSNNTRVIHGWRTKLLCIVPIIITVLVWTNNYHHLMWYDEHLSTTDSFVITVKTYGPAFWVALVYNYVLIISGGIVLLRRLFVGTRLYTGQAVALLIAVFLPWLWNIIYVFDLVPLPRKDLTPVMFAISGMAVVLGLLRFRLFAIIPFAHRFVIKQLNDGIFTFNAGNCLVEANPMALKILRLDEKIVGKKLEDLLPLSPVFERLSSAKFGREETTLTLADEERFFEIEKTPMLADQEKQVGWLAILHDITERKKMEEQLIMQERLASIGQLSSGIAHEINNPLTGVITFSSLLLQRELPEDIKDDLNIINEEAQRTKRIVKNLLTFARQQPQEKQATNINEGIQKVLELRAYEQKTNNIRVNDCLAPDLPYILGNGSQLQQVFFNIVINAEFFMLEAHGEGTLTITTERAGDFVRVSFTDDGPGISRENIRNIFNPFFSTKEIGKGTGLGLSICHGIITEHGGKIWAEGEPGKGATFFIDLPVYNPDADNHPE